MFTALNEWLGLQYIWAKKRVIGQKMQVKDFSLRKFFYLLTSADTRGQALVLLTGNHVLDALREGPSTPGCCWIFGFSLSPLSVISCDLHMLVMDEKFSNN